MAHERANALLAPFALDAIDEEERTQVELHLAECPRCRVELDSYRHVAATLGNCVEAPPDEVWRTIFARLAPVANDQPSTLSTRDGPPTRAHRGRMAALVTIALGAAAAATGVGIALTNADNRVAQLQGAISETAHTAVIAALETPGHRVVNLRNAQHRVLAQFVLLPNGRGYLVQSHLPALSTRQVYQLWGVIGGQTISLGLLGRAPGLATFTLTGSPGPSSLGVSVEVAGGAVEPSGMMLASGVA